MATEISLITTALAPVGEGFRASPLPTSAALPASASGKVVEAAQVPLLPAQNLDEAVRELSDYVAQSGAELNFRIDEDSGRVVVSIVDARDGTVLRQMPSEEALRIARALSKYEPCLIEAQA